MVKNQQDPPPLLLFRSCHDMLHQSVWFPFSQNRLRSAEEKRMFTYVHSVMQAGEAGGRASSGLRRRTITTEASDITSDSYRRSWPVKRKDWVTPVGTPLAPAAPHYRSTSVVRWNPPSTGRSQVTRVFSQFRFVVHVNS